MAENKRGRLHLLDALRGFLMINMIAFHGMWDLVYLFGVKADWYAGTPKYIWQQFICWSFILLSGFCWKLSRNHLRRGALVFGGGAVVSLVTCLLMPENRILFGILTCLGSCVVLMIPLEKLLKAFDKTEAEFAQLFKFLSDNREPVKVKISRKPSSRSYDDFEKFLAEIFK